MSKGLGSKNFQKKVVKVLKDFIHSEKVQSFLNDINEDDDIAILLNPESFNEFDDELQTLISTIDKAFKYCSRTRGKKSESISLNEDIRSKLLELVEQEKSLSNQNLPSSKRGRDDDQEEDNDHPNKRRGSLKIKNQHLSNEDKVKLKDIVNKITKDPESEPFLYPVDKSVFPAYYEIIDHPMDLTTWKKKISEYANLKMAFDDLHMIWMNCCTFNAEGSDIIATAYRLGVDADAMIESYFGKSEVDSSWKKLFKGVKLPKSHSPKETAVSSAAENSKDEIASSGQKPKAERKKRKSSLGMENVTIGDIKELLKTLYEDDRTLLFRTPVTDAVAPGYSDIVSEPMDLGTIKKKIRGHLYGDDAQAVMRDIRLVWSNCQLYNAPGSDIFNLATELDEYVESKLKDITTSKSVSAVAISAKKEEIDTSKIGKSVQASNTPPIPKQVKLLEARVPADQDLGIVRVDDQQLLSLTMGAVRDLLALLRDFPEIAYFLKPIQEEDAPGYFDVIKSPIDVSTIEKKCQLGSYQNKPLQFVYDVRLMWRNCLVYNLHESAIYKAAVLNSRRFEDCLRNVLRKDYKPVLLEKLVTTENGDEEENEGLIEDEDDFNENDDIDTLHDNDVSGSNVTQDIDADKAAKNHITTNRKRRTFCTFRVRKYRHVLRLISEHELASSFLELPSSHPEYFDKVQNPLALVSIKKKINEYQEIPLGFLSDVKLVFDNWMSFSSPSSQLYYSARVVKNFAVDLFYQNFPSLTALKTTEDEHCIAEHRSSSNIHQIIDEPHRKRHRDESDTDIKPSVSITQRPIQELSVNAAVTNQVETDLPPLFPSISRVEYKNRVDELDAFLSGEKAAQSDLFRRTAHAKAATLLKESKLPFILAPSLYEIANYGSIVPAVSSSRKALYPIDYEILRIMRLAVIPEESLISSEHVKDYPYVSFVFKSKIKMETETDRLLFVVELDNGVVAGKGRSAKEAWTEVIGNGLSLLQTASNKLIRCRAVFNRVCVSPDCVSFLEQVPLDMVDYYSVIKSPMWLREVHNRLSDGAYDNEFDFAWDMRLIFRNCKEFNVSNSALYKQADRLSNLFEQLFVAWVINVQDASITDIAKGEWTEWTDLRYFDTKPGSENICKITGKKAALSDLLQCQFCEDYYLPSTVGLPASRAHSKTKWGCARCTHALELAGNNLAGDPFSLEPETKYPAENTFVMVPELGIGWLQAKRKRGGLKNLFLSPLGYEILSKDLIDAQKEFENTVDKELLAARAKEFQESLPGKNSAGGKTRGGRYRSPTKEKKSMIRSFANDSSSSDDNNNSNNIQTPFDAKYLDNGRIINGKLVNFHIPVGYRLAYFATANEGEIIAAQMSGKEITTAMLETFAECTVENIPEYGYFGFHLPEIRSRLEGLDGALECKTYEFATYSEDSKEDIVAIMKRKVEEAKYMLEAEEKMKMILLDERWRYERAKLLPTKPSNLNAEKPILAQFRKLFPVKHFEGLDIVVSVWDFLHACKSIGYVHFTLADVVSSTQPCGAVHNVMQTVFDEIGCIFTDFLFQEVKNRGLFLPLTENNWQNICMVYPINTLTWPKVFEKILLLLGMPLSVEEANIVLTHTSGGQCLGQFKLLLLLYNHPLIDEFLRLKETSEPLAKLRRSLIDQTLSLSTAYLGVDGFGDSVLEIFSSVRSLHNVSEVLIAKAEAIHNWLRNLMKRMGIKSVSATKCPASNNGNEEMMKETEGNETEDMKEAEVSSKEKQEDYDENSGDDDRADVNLQEQLASFDVDYNQDRQYGGFSLSQYSTSNDPLFVLMPHHLNVHTPMTCLDIKCRAFLSLERSLFVLNGDAEFWSVAERIHLYHTLLDLSLATSDFRKCLNEENRRLSSTCQSFRSSEMPVILSEAHTKSLSSVPRAATCVYTGVSYSMVPEPSKWTILPNDYVRSDNANDKVVTEQELQDTSTATISAAVDSTQLVNSNMTMSKRRGRDVVDGQNYVLTEALSRVIHCRRFAESDKAKYIEQMGNIVQKSFFPQFDLSFKNTMFARSKPLGYDAAGNVYWLFHVQSAMTLFPFDDKGRCLDPTDSNTSEPCILMQDPASTWYYLSSRYLASLLEHLNDSAECEQLLRLRLIEKFYIINRSLRLSTLDIKPLQHAWLQRKMHVESWLTEQSYQGPNELHRCRMLEVMWARAAEARMHMYYAYVFKLDDDVERISERAEREALLRKQKRIKEDSFDEVFDLHPRRGWNRLDYFTRLRQLAATTTASVLHSDPNVAKTLAAFVYPKSSFLVRNTLNVTQVNTANNENDEDEAPPKVPARVTRSSHTEQLVMDVDEEKEEITENKDLPDADAMDVDDNKEEVSENVVKNDVLVKKSPGKAIDNRPLSQHFDRSFGTANVEPNDEDATHPSLSNLNHISGAASADGPANVLHVNVPSYDGMNILPPRSTKAVEQLHILTGELLRIYASGKHAAQFLDLSQSGISQCLTNVKTDCYGFRWRYYIGPPIDFHEIEPYQTPASALTILQNDKNSIEVYRRWCAAGHDPSATVPDLTGESLALMQKTLPPGVGRQYLVDAITRSVNRLATVSAAKYNRNNHNNTNNSSSSVPLPPPAPTVQFQSNSISTKTISSLNNNNAVVGLNQNAAKSGMLPLETLNPHSTTVYAPSAALETDPNASYYAFPPMHLSKGNVASLPQIVTSVKLASAKLVKLKGELFNIMYSFPEKALKWPVLDEASEELIAKAGEDAAKSTIAHQRQLPNPPSEDDIARMADKNARKIKRRMRRKMAIEQFALTVQSATTAQDLLKQVLLLEAAVPVSLTFVVSQKAALPVTAATVAEVAQRLYAFDRSIAYDAISNIDAAFLNCPFRLRTNFVPKCHVHAFCFRYMGHTGKCQTATQNVLLSRLPDQFQLAPPNDPFSNQRNNTYREFNYTGGNAQNNANAANTVQRPAYQRPVAMTNNTHQLAPRVEVMPRLSQLVEKLNPDIEKEQGYLPVNSEIMASIWL